MICRHVALRTVAVKDQQVPSYVASSDGILVRPPLFGPHQAPLEWRPDVTQKRYRSPKVHENEPHGRLAPNLLLAQRRPLRVLAMGTPRQAEHACFVSWHCRARVLAFTFSLSLSVRDPRLCNRGIVWITMSGVLTDSLEFEWTSCKKR